MPRVLRILGTLAAVVAAYGAYALTAVPLIEPPAGARWQGAPSLTGDPGDRLAPFRGLFPPDAWELQERTLLESDELKLLWGTMTDNRDGSIKLEPCTAIYAPHGASAIETERAREAVVLQAPQGAELTLSEPLDLARGTFGQFVKGRLRGPITIRGEGRLPGPADDLRAATSELEWNEERLWTKNALEFTLGPNQGRGTGLVVCFLRGEDTSSAQRHGLNIAGIQSVEVPHLERLRLYVSPKGWGAGPPPPSAPSEKRPAAEPPLVPIEIACRGLFGYDVLQQLATFHDQVDLRVLNPNGPADQVSCDESLAVQFARRRPPRPGEEKKTQAGRLAMSDLEPSRIEAKGHPVAVHAPSREVEARGTRLEYDLAANQVTLEDPQGAFLQKGPPARRDEIHAPYVRYQYAGAGRVGQAEARGPGRLRAYLKDPPAQPFEARWNGRLTLAPDGGQPLVSLTGGTQVSYGVLGELAAPEIYFWLLELPPSGPEEKLRVDPDRLWAGRKEGPGRREVRLSSPKLSGNVDRLEVWFERQSAAPDQYLAPPSPTPPSPVTVGREKGDSPHLPERPATNLRSVPGFAQTGTVPFFPPANPPADLAGRVSAAAQTVWRATAGPIREAVSPQHFHVEGDLLRAQMTLIGEKSEVAKLRVEGNALVVETQTNRPDEKPIRVLGSLIEVTNASKPYAAVTLTGNPAQFEGRGLRLVGPSIQLNRGTSHLLVAGPGQMEVLVPRDLQGRPIPGGVPLTIAWQGRMELVEGRRMHFEGSVAASVQQQQLETETLDAIFQEPIRFDDPQGRPEPKVEKLLASGGVILRSREFDARGPLALMHMEIPDLEIDAGTGRMKGNGPGTVTMIRRGAPELFGRRPAAPPPEADKDSLSCLHLAFQGAITGRQESNQVTFHEGVWAVYGAVPTWEPKLPPAPPFRPDFFDPRGATLNCQELSLAEMTAPAGTRRPLLLEAKENAVVESQQGFVARARRITYDQSKGLMVLEGDGRVDASLYLQRRPGDRPEEHRARTISFWPETKEFKYDKMRVLDLRG